MRSSPPPFDSSHSHHPHTHSPTVLLHQTLSHSPSQRKCSRQAQVFEAKRKKQAGHQSQAHPEGKVPRKLLSNRKRKTKLLQNFFKKKESFSIFLLLIFFSVHLFFFFLLAFLWAFFVFLVDSFVAGTKDTLLFLLMVERRIAGSGSHAHRSPYCCQHP